MSKDKRKFPRTTLNEETIYFLRESGDNPSERTYSPAVITDISRGGVGMRVGIPHEVDDQIWLEGIADLTGAQPGYVKWVRDSGNDSYHIGVEFEGIRG